MFNKLFSLLFFFVYVVHGNFNTDGNIIFGADHVTISPDGNLLQLSLDQASGSGFQSKDGFLYGKFDMQIKLVPGDSAGTITTFYLKSQGNTWDEVDFEFLGNVPGRPYILSTNVFTQGIGGREQQFRLWFDPRADFHSYSILWNPHQIIFYIDGTPIRVFRNIKAQGVLYPIAQPMRVMATIWNSTWVLQRINWAHAPFTASYRSYVANACVLTNGQLSCPLVNVGWQDQVISAIEEGEMKATQERYMYYNYCKDTKRYPRGKPPECSL